MGGAVKSREDERGRFHGHPLAGRPASVRWRPSGTLLARLARLRVGLHRSRRRGPARGLARDGESLVVGLLLAGTGRAAAGAVRTPPRLRTPAVRPAGQPPPAAPPQPQPRRPWHPRPSVEP